MILSRAKRDEAGATAIEYAVIGALIGIGLIGALVGTKGSLSAIFGTAATQMASGTATSGGSSIPPASSSARYAYWSAKTLARKDVFQLDPQQTQTNFFYTDGSSASIRLYTDAKGNVTSYWVNSYPIGFSGRTMDSLQFTYGADGSQQSMIYIDRYSNGIQRLQTTSSAPNWYETNMTFNTNGTTTGTSQGGVTAQNVRDLGQADGIYFRAIANDP